MSRGRLMLELRRARGPLIVVLTITVAGFGAVVWMLSNQVFQQPWVKYMQVRGAFDDVKGVLPGKDEVRIAGVKVGLVTSEQLVDGQPVLTLAVRKRYAPVYRDATLRLRPNTPLEDMYVELTRGHAGSGRLRPGEIIHAAQTVSPVDISRVLQTFDTETRERLRYLLAGFGQGLAGRGQDLEQAFVQIVPFLQSAEQVSREVAQRRARLAQLVTSMGRLTNAIGARDQALTGLVRDGNAALGTLARSDVPLAQTLHRLPLALDSLRRALTTVGEARVALDPTLQLLRPTAHALQPALTALDNLSGELRPAADALQPALDALTPLAHALPATAADLRGSFRGLAPMAPDLDLATRQVAACRNGAVQFFLNTLSLGKFEDAFGAWPRGEVSAGPDSLELTHSGPDDVSQLPPPSGGEPGVRLVRVPTCTAMAGIGK